MKKPLNEEPGVMEHDGIDCCYSAIYGLGCDGGIMPKREATEKSKILRIMSNFV